MNEIIRETCAVLDFIRSQWSYVRWHERKSLLHGNRWTLSSSKTRLCGDELNTHTCIRAKKKQQEQESIYIGRSDSK